MRAPLEKMHQLVLDLVFVVLATTNVRTAFSAAMVSNGWGRGRGRVYMASKSNHL